MSGFPSFVKGRARRRLGMHRHNLGKVIFGRINGFAAIRVGLLAALGHWRGDAEFGEGR